MDFFEIIFFLLAGLVGEIDWLFLCCTPKPRLGGFVVQFEVLKESVGLQRTVFDGCLDRASRFSVMLAVSEAAELGELFNISKRLADSLNLLGQLQFAHTG